MNENKSKNNKSKNNKIKYIKSSNLTNEILLSRIFSLYIDKTINNVLEETKKLEYLTEENIEIIKEKMLIQKNKYLNNSTYERVKDKLFHLDNEK
jgi:DNA-directed RNA polymerase